MAALVAPPLFRPAVAGARSAGAAASGLVVANPPYGKRLGETQELVPLYERLGERLKAGFAGWEAAVYTANPELGAHLGLRAHRVNSLYNGPLEGKLLLFHVGPAQTQAATAEAGWSGFANRLQKNHRHLRRWAAREGIHCYRVYDADIPEFAVAVDIYEDWAHVQEYAPPAGVDPVRARRRLKEVMAAVPEVLGMPAEQVVLKVRRRQRGADQYQKLDTEGGFLEVREAGLRFLVNLTDYLDTGLFLDHRLTRRLVRELAPGRRFLNLFAYTGSASVYAASGAAAATTTIDLSAVYLEWARRNMALNGFTGRQHSFVRADCLEWLADASSRRRAAYDLVFLDAPTFSNSKSMSDTLDIQRDHPRLIRQAVALLGDGGILLFSTNFRRFKLEASLASEFAVRDITRQTIPPDFARNPRIHTCYRIERLSVAHAR